MAGDIEMGTVIRFRPMVRPARGLGPLGTRSESATIIILPVVRIERFSDAPTSGLEPATGSSRRRARRRRASRP
jgi:hypothetical protein